MLAKRKEKDVIDRLPDQIDFHGMTAEELAGKSGLLKKLTSRFIQKSWKPKWMNIRATRKMTTPEIIPVTVETVTQRRLSSVMTTTQSKFMFHEIETAHLNL